MTNETTPKPTCPKGHPVKKRFGRHMCSKAECGETKAANAGSHTLNLDAMEANPLEALAEQQATLVQIPKGLKGDEAVKWSQEKMMELLPQAVAKVAWRLRYGTEKQQDEATDKVLRANGMDRRDTNNGQGQQGLIVLNIGTDAAVQNIPWLQRVKPGTPEKE